MRVQLMIAAGIATLKRILNVDIYKPSLLDRIWVLLVPLTVLAIR